MEAKLIPFKFNFTSNVIQSISEMEDFQYGHNEEMLTPEVTIERIKLPKREPIQQGFYRNEVDRDGFLNGFPMLTEGEANLEADAGDLSLEEGMPSTMTEFMPHFLLDFIGESTVSSDMDNQVRFGRTRQASYQCPLCDHSTFRQYSLKIHIKSVHGNYKPYSCPLCTYCSAERKMLRRHILSVHERYKPHKCTECDYSASLNSNLKKHVENVHWKNKPFRCPQCSYGSSEKGKLKRHFDAVHNNSRPYNCQFCSYSANRVTTLKSHIWSMHVDGDRSFTCNMCPFSTNDYSNLERHTMTAHDGLQINKIEPPEPAFRHTSLSNIVKESFFNIMRADRLECRIGSVHNLDGQKFFECGDCKKHYRDKRSLKAHILSVHLQEKPYQCQLCSFNTVDSRYLNRHMARVHYDIK